MATYAALRLDVDSWRWEGVPFYVRAGKCLEMTATEVFVELKLPPQVVFTEADAVSRQLRALPPEPAGRDRASARAPSGRAKAWWASRWSCRSWSSRPRRRLGDYERLLGDAMAGDATLFARQDVVEAAWAIVDPVIQRARARCSSTSPARGDRRRPTGWSRKSAAGTRRNEAQP